MINYKTLETTFLSFYLPGCTWIMDLIMFEYFWSLPNFLLCCVYALHIMLYLSNFLLSHFMLGICTSKLTYLQSNNFACYWYFSHSRVQLRTTINRFSETINKFYARLGNRNQGDDSKHANIIISRSIGAGVRAWT